MKKFYIQDYNATILILELDNKNTNAEFVLTNFINHYELESEDEYADYKRKLSNLIKNDKIKFAGLDNDPFFKDNVDKDCFISTESDVIEVIKDIFNYHKK